MSGILIYSPDEAKRNEYIVNRLCNELGVTLVTTDRLDFLVEPDYVINRTNDYKIAERFEQKGIRVFNNSAFSRLANDKQACYDFMEKNGVSILPTRYSTPPFIKKPIDSHGGNGVEMCHNSSDYDEKMVCQKPATDLGKDLRVWVIGGEIICSILRVSKDDFRSNFCLGGEAIPYDLSSAEIDEIKKIIALVDGDYYGVDFLFNNGKIIFNELEDTVGARMIYAKTEIDIIKLYCDYLKQFIK